MLGYPAELRQLASWEAETGRSVRGPFVASHPCLEAALRGFTSSLLQLMDSEESQQARVVSLFVLRSFCPFRHRPGWALCSLPSGWRASLQRQWSRPRPSCCRGDWMMLHTVAFCMGLVRSASWQRQQRRPQFAFVSAGTLVWQFVSCPRQTLILNLLRLYSPLLRPRGGCRIGCTVA